MEIDPAMQLWPDQGFWGGNKSSILIERGMKNVTVQSSMLEVKSGVLIERGMKKSRSRAPRSRSKVVFLSGGV